MFSPELIEYLIRIFSELFYDQNYFLPLILLYSKQWEIYSWQNCALLCYYLLPHAPEENIFFVSHMSSLLSFINMFFKRNFFLPVLTSLFILHRVDLHARAMCVSSSVPEWIFCLSYSTLVGFLFSILLIPLSILDVFFVIFFSLSTFWSFIFSWQLPDCWSQNLHNLYHCFFQ